MDFRSQEILEKIKNDIELIDNPVFMNSYINIKYRFKGEKKLRQLLIDSPLEFAAFAAHQNLISCYDVNEDGVHMYQRVIHSDINRYSYPVSKPGYVEVEKLFTGFTEQEIIKMIAVREYDFGDRNYTYAGKKGLVIPMLPADANTKRTA